MQAVETELRDGTQADTNTSIFLSSLVFISRLIIMGDNFEEGSGIKLLCIMFQTFLLAKE
jgi:hypothetical protein